MTRLLGCVALLGATGCGKYAPVSYQEAIRVEPVVGLPALCASFVPDAGRLPRKEADAWLEAREALKKGDVATANRAVSGLAAHPARDSVQLVYQLVEGEGEPSADMLEQLANAYPEDACLLQLAGTAMLGIDSSLAQSWIRQASELDPDNPDVALMMAVFQTDDANERQETLVALAEKHPDHAATQVLVGRASVSMGEIETAAVAFERAYDLGAVEVGEALFHLRRMTGRLGPYLTQAKSDDQPVTAVDFGADPVAGLEGWLGLDNPTDHVRATFKTSSGDVACELFHRKAPVTVINFMALARGQQSWTDPANGEATERKLYDGTIFHRVIPEFMIQGGDPLGTGEGFPGYRFRDELHPDLRFDRPGRLAMANSGPDTNGSQFFITEVPTPHLDGLHTIFGQCENLDVVESIARVPSVADRPEDDVVLSAIEFDVKPCETCTQ